MFGIINLYPFLRSRIKLVDLLVQILRLEKQRKWLLMLLYFEERDASRYLFLKSD